MNIKNLMIPFTLWNKNKKTNLYLSDYPLFYYKNTNAQQNNLKYCVRILFWAGMVGHGTNYKEALLNLQETFELYKSTLILWSPSMKQPVEVDKYCTAIDIVPTLANLFGLEYDSRLYIGKDILSTSEGLVMFQDKSFITDRMMYNAATGEVTSLTTEELPEEYLKVMKQVVKNRFKISKGIIDLDYYRYLPNATLN